MAPYETQCFEKFLDFSHSSNWRNLRVPRTMLCGMVLTWLLESVVAVLRPVVALLWAEKYPLPLGS